MLNADNECHGDVIQTAQEHQLKLIRVEALMAKRELCSGEELELSRLVDAIHAYESIHYPTPRLSEVVISAITWHAPDEASEDWIERWAIIGFYTLRVWLSMNGTFEASLTRDGSGVRSRLSIGSQNDLKSACEIAAEVAIKSMIKHH
ncbi:hypothetical protein KW459_15625 [Vibrio fluvialis]|nr:hypothetical protein [Vibrio fluvialis]